MQAGANAVPQIPVGEGEVYLFVRLDAKTGAFQCLYPDLFSALALLSMASTFVDIQKTKAMTPAIVEPAGKSILS
jgi:hypothetical protein